MRKFELKIVNEVPLPDFGDNKESWVLSAFLEDAGQSFSTFLKEIEKAEKNQDVPTGVVGNSVDAEFYPNKAIIEARWFNDEGFNDGENFASVEISLLEAKQLLLTWRKVLGEWKAKP